MLKYIVLFVALCHYGSATIAGNNKAMVQYFTQVWYDRTLSKLMDVLEIPQMLERYATETEKMKIRDRVLRFSWSDCGSSSDPVKIKSLSLSPDPLVLPGQVTISFDASTTINITAPLQVDLTIKKKVAFIWIEIPCIDQQGSCTYSDICSILPASCPPDFIKYNVPCHCPASQGEYVLPEGKIDLPSLPLPSWATHGDYKLNAVGSLNGKSLFCYDLTLSLG